MEYLLHRNILLCEFRKMSTFCLYELLVAATCFYFDINTRLAAIYVTDFLRFFSSLLLGSSIFGSDYYVIWHPHAIVVETDTTGLSIEPKWRLKQVRIRFVPSNSTNLWSINASSCTHRETQTRMVSHQIDFERKTNFKCVQLNWLTEIFKTRFICFKGISHFECSNVRRTAIMGNNRNDNKKQQQ